MALCGYRDILAVDRSIVETRELGVMNKAGPLG